MIILAGALGTFVLFLFLGFIALPVTAALDKSIGKEKGLLLYTVVLLAFTLLLLMPSGPKRGGAKAGVEKTVPADVLDQKGHPFARAEPDYEAERNPFQKYSDTRPLPPVELETPPWIPLSVALPMRSGWVPVPPAPRFCYSLV